MNNKPLIGQIGVGSVGSAYANNFEDRGYDVVRYDVDEHQQGIEAIPYADIVFIAVPTPRTPEDGFDGSNLEDALEVVGEGNIAVILSTILPGTTNKMQKKFPNKYILHKPEFLTERNAEKDVQNPDRHLIGYTDKSESVTKEVLNVLPVANFEKEMPAKIAEITKYGGNCWFYFKIIFMNLLFEVCQQKDIDFELVKENMAADPRVGRSHLDVQHQGGRGAGGNCFVKDMAAFHDMYENLNKEDLYASQLLQSLQLKNIEVMLESGKDLDIIKQVFGEDIINNLQDD